MDVGLKVPHCDAGVQDHVTPSLLESFVTVAATLAVPWMRSEAGGGVLRVTEITGAAVIVICDEVVMALFVDNVATIVTVPPEGTLVGAV